MQKIVEAIEDHLNISLLDFKIMELDILLINNNNIKRLFFKFFDKLIFNT